MPFVPAASKSERLFVSSISGAGTQRPISLAISPAVLCSLSLARSLALLYNYARPVWGHPLDTVSLNDR